MTLEVFFGGTTWILNSDTVNTIAHYASILDDIPELGTLMDGLLFTDFVSVLKAYFWLILLLWAVLSTGLARGFCILAFIVALAPSFMRPVFTGRQIRRASREFRHAMILYFTFHRVYINRAWGQFLRFVVFLVVLFTAAPKPVIIVVLPLMLSSVLITTEGIVNRMQVK
jgi:hypothetical protein